ncbi:IQ domain-containing protein C isoform X2 [Phodopus roborovskii]|uniref:IQ domain-containing protein C isoform X2 n=1 Tax=Phodopus roborovskii TaxID=109678 RepID=UPI0021E43F00|nr:IQ domain-containing protein C isoform X2 [Phodopus roborovskii]
MKEPDVFLHKAGIRGFLVRRQFQSLRAEYEAIVQEIEGDLSTLQWTGGWIPKPVFLPEAKSHRSWKTEKAPNPEQKLCNHFPYKDSEKDVILEEVVLKKARGSQAKARSLCQDDSSWLQTEQDRKARQGKTRDISMSEEDNAVTDLGLSQSQHELQDQRNHLAMELLWLQQAINSRKEYLILKQTLRSPEASQTRDKPNTLLDHGGQSSYLPKDQSCRDRTTGEPCHADDACHKGDSQLHKSPDSLASTGKNTVGAKGWKLCYRKATALDSQARGDRVTKGPDHREQALNETCLQQLLEGQTPEDPKSRSPCSGKATTQLPTFYENPNTEDKYSRKPSYKEADCHRDRLYDLSISEGHMIWNGTSTGLEQGSLGVRRTKPPKSQHPSTRSTRHGITDELSQEGWENQKISGDVVFHKRGPVEE